MMRVKVWGKAIKGWVLCNKFIVKDPRKIKFWRMMSITYPKSITSAYGRGITIKRVGNK